MPERFSIVQVSPYAWDGGHEVNELVEQVSRRLAQRGHSVLVVAPSESAGLVRESRKAIRAAAKDPARLRPEPGAPPRVLGAGDVLPVGSARRGSRRLPVDVARTVEEALTAAQPDFVHVHEPFAPSTASAALRHSRSLNVGSFHAPTERALSTQVARRVVELFFGRLDARTASFTATGDLMAQFFPAPYRVVLPGAGGSAPAPRGANGSSTPLRIAFAHREERPALRLFLRALRRLPLEAEWRVALWSRLEAGGASTLRRDVRERLDVTGPGQGPATGALGGADVAVFASTGVAPAPGMLLEALASGAVPVAARLPVYEEVLADGDLGLLFEPGDVETLSAQLGRLVTDAGLRERLRAAGDELRGRLDWDRVTDEMEEVYASVAARRHDERGHPRLRSRLAGRPLIDVDLHMHTDHSHDCATPVEVLLHTARERGLGAIAVTDHNEISGALEARAKAEGVKVIVAEEVKTAKQGEVIGLFIEEKIPRGLTLEETIAEIRRQGGLVYVPHPFDRLHSVPDYEHLLDMVEEIDILEVFNPRVALTAFNEEAVRFAAKYRIVPGAGSDSHVAQGLGSVMIRVHDFDGAAEFLEAMRNADIVRKHKNLVYVQALKFLQTSGGRGGRGHPTKGKA